MSKLEEAKTILAALGLPTAQQNEISSYTLLALLQLKESDPWSNSKKINLGISKGIMKFISNEYKREYAPNTRETFRRQVLHQFMQAGIVYYNPKNPNLPVNSPRAHYSISDIALSVIKEFKSNKWNIALKNFSTNVNSQKNKFERKRKLNKISINLPNGVELKLSPGKHNILESEIIYKFMPQFASNSIVLFIGDTENKNLYFEQKLFDELRIPFDEHNKFPDVILFDKNKNWLYLIEAVTSHGPVNNKRHIELEELLSECKVGKIFVTAFLDFTSFKKYSNDIAWETEVWISENPEHMIHYNGDKFLGPR